MKRERMKEVDDAKFTWLNKLPRAEENTCMPIDSQKAGIVGPVRYVLEDLSQSTYKEKDFIVDDNDHLSAVRCSKSITSALFIRSSSASLRSTALRGKRASCVACSGVSRRAVADRHSSCRCNAAPSAECLLRRNQQFHRLEMRLNTNKVPESYLKLMISR